MGHAASVFVTRSTNVGGMAVSLILLKPSLGSHPSFTANWGASAFNRAHRSTVPVLTIAQDRSPRVGDMHQVPVRP